MDDLMTTENADDTGINTNLLKALREKNRFFIRPLR